MKPDNLNLNENFDKLKNTGKNSCFGSNIKPDNLNLNQNFDKLKNADKNSLLNSNSI